MSTEINMSNLPVEESYRIFIDFINEAIRDPVLKNYICLMDLFRESLPIFFRHLPPQKIKNEEMIKLIRSIIHRTSDLKQKVREASTTFCLFLSHQSPLGPEVMMQLVL